VVLSLRIVAKRGFGIIITYCSCLAVSDSAPVSAVFPLTDSRHNVISPPSDIQQAKVLNMLAYLVSSASLCIYLTHLNAQASPSPPPPFPRALTPLCGVTLSMQHPPRVRGIRLRSVRTQKKKKKVSWCAILRTPPAPPKAVLVVRISRVGFRLGGADQELVSHGIRRFPAAELGYKKCRRSGGGVTSLLPVHEVFYIRTGG
jgi:hypothetical protein